MRTPIRHRVSWNFVGLLLTAVAFALPRTASADICHADDVVIDGSLGVGFDAVCNMNFGFDTICSERKQSADLLRRYQQQCELPEK